MVLGGITLYKTFALYEEKKEFNILQGKIPDFLSFNVNYVIDGVTSNTKPNNDGKYLQTKIECSGVNIYNWDNKKWEV